MYYSIIKQHYTCIHTKCICNMRIVTFTSQSQMVFFRKVFFLTIDALKISEIVNGFIKKLFSKNSQKPGLFYLYVRFTQCIKATVTCVQYGQNQFFSKQISKYASVCKLASTKYYIANSYTNAGQRNGTTIKNHSLHNIAKNYSYSRFLQNIPIWIEMYIVHKWQSAWYTYTSQKLLWSNNDQ